MILPGPKRRKQYLTLETAAQPTTAPTSASDGVETEEAAPNGQTLPLKWLIEIHSSDRSTASTITDGGTVYGYNGNSWFALGALNAGTDIVVSTQGYSEVLSYIGLYERVAFAASGVTVNIDVFLTPIDEHVRR